VKRVYELLAASLVVVLLLLLAGCTSSYDQPGKGVTVHSARAGWDTGWFQTEVYRTLLTELGYTVSEPETLDNVAFYVFTAQGDVDFWANGWFPLHDRYLDYRGVAGKLGLVGFQVRVGALQGYLIDIASANRLGISNLDALRDPDVAAVFDADGDGKADLVGCNVGWACERVIEHHLQAYGLEDTVAHVQGEYSQLAHLAIERYQAGEPILLYTWTPNWTISQLAVGEDVMWLPVPFSSDPDDPEVDSLVAGIPGCLEDPCDLGFVASDIRVVANLEFLEANPAAAILLELVEIPLEDISAQNERLADGEDSAEEIRQHASEWILENRALADGWVTAARDGAR